MTSAYRMHNSSPGNCPPLGRSRHPISQGRRSRLPSRDPKSSERRKRGPARVRRDRGCATRSGPGGPQFTRRFGRSYWCGCGGPGYDARCLAAAPAGIPFIRTPVRADEAASTDVPAAAHTTSHGDDLAGYDPNVLWMGDERIAILLYPGMTVMDLTGPRSMFAAMMVARIHLVARSLDPVTSDGA